MPPNSAEKTTAPENGWKELPGVCWEFKCDVKQQVNIRQSGNITLDGFVILASDTSKDMAYITADVSIDYSDQRAYHEIQNNLSFYRGLIYDSINKSLASGKRDEITEADIIWIVETNLKKILPGNYISRVSFKSFKAS